MMEIIPINNDYNLITDRTGRQFYLLYDIIYSSFEILDNQIKIIDGIDLIRINGITENKLTKSINSFNGII